MKWTDYFYNAKQRLNGSNNNEESRSEFQKDYDRIIFSSAFRRLQNKTQVLPFPKSDYVRNRLTHSLETASVGRSLGNIVGKTILEKYPDLKRKLKIQATDFGHLVSAACLTHDIGNPPFGHSGEDAIASYFQSEKAQEFIKDLTHKQKADLQNFEGNASGFRLIANTLEKVSNFPGGLRLTRGTYATFVKYPKESLPDRKAENKASLKKFGIYQSEIEEFENQIAKPLNLITQHTVEGKAWKRFPLTFLVEAADDICYHIIDFEDGYHMNFVPFKLLEELFQAIIDWDEKNLNRYKEIYSEREKVNYLRSLAINQLVKDTSDIFLEREQEFLSGDLDVPLLNLLLEKKSEILKRIIGYSVENIYQSDPVLKIEVTGQKVIPNLLHHFIQAILTPETHKQLFKLLPEEYRFGKNKYEKILNITMFVSNMTDRQAVELFRNLNGISLPEY